MMMTEPESQAGKIPGNAARAAGRARLRHGLCPVFLALLALGDGLLAGNSRQTFVFYPLSGPARVEERMIRRSPSRELALRRYVEEYLLGPVSPDLEPLFPRDTVLRSLMLRGGVLYADLSAEAAAAVLDGADPWRGFLALNAGIRRNFGWLRDVRLFIEGSEVWPGRFRVFFERNGWKWGKMA